MNIVYKLKNLVKNLISIKLFPSAIFNILNIYKYKKSINANISIVILFEHIGDIIACEPVSRYLKNELNSKVVWIVKDSYSELLTLFCAVDKVIKVKTLSEVIYMKMFLHSSNVYNLHFDKARKCSKYNLILRNSNKTYTFANYYNHGSILETFSTVGNLPPLNSCPYLNLATNDRFPELSTPFIAIQIESNDIQRMWDIEKWEQLISNYPDLSFVLIGLRSYFTYKHNCITRYCGKLSLVDIAYLINKSRLFIGIDSSCAHYANALKVPSIILLGKYNSFERYNPYSGYDHNFKILHYTNLKDLPVEMVQNELVSLVTTMDENNLIKNN